MSNNPLFNSSSIKLRGDINVGLGQLGMTTQAVDTINTPILHTPPTFYTDYYHNYLVDATDDGEFNLAVIGPSGVSVGYTMCIDILNTPIPPPPANQNPSLSIRDSLGNEIAKLWKGGKIFLTAYAAPNTWKTAYAVPEGRDNWLIVYTGKYPEVRLLPIQKEFFYNASFEYGIKCLVSFDSTEPALLTNLTNFTNLNRIIFQGCTNIDSPTLSTLAVPAISSLITCDGINYLPDGESISSAIACYNGGGIEQLGDSKGVFIAGCNNCLVDNSLGNRTLNNCGIFHSSNSTIDGNMGGLIENVSMIASSLGCTIRSLAPTDTTNGCTIIGSSNSDIVTGISTNVISSIDSSVTRGQTSSLLSTFNSNINNSTLSSDISTFNCAITDNILTSAINSDTCTATLTGDGIVTRGVNGYNNNRAGITLLSSFNVPALVSAADLRYCVIGGFNAPTWSIDSKTGEFYGLGTFNTGTPLPGFAEMYENLTHGQIPHGRLLQLDGDKVRLARNGESGFMISRPYESAAFVAGNPKLEWSGKYSKNLYGETIYESVTKEKYIELLKSEGKDDDYISQLELSDSVEIKKLNPDYDPKVEYKSRSDRNEEWTTCEKMGIVVVEYKGELSKGDYVISADDGYATRSSRQTNILVLDIIDDSHAKVDLSNYHLPSYIEHDSTVADGVLSIPDSLIKDIVFANNSFSVTKKKMIKITAKASKFDDILLVHEDGTKLDFDVLVYKKCEIATLKQELPAGSYKIYVAGADNVKLTVKVW